MSSKTIRKENSHPIVVHLESETFSYSPTFITKAELHTPATPEPSSLRLTSSTFPKKKRYQTEQFKLSFLASLRDAEEKCYDINDISFFELGGNEE